MSAGDPTPEQMREYYLGSKTRIPSGETPVTINDGELAEIKLFLTKISARLMGIADALNDAGATNLGTYIVDIAREAGKRGY